MPDRIEVRAVRNGGRDFIEVPTASEATVAALLRERAGYAARRLPDRVAAVDVELKRLGVEPAPADTPVKGAPTDDRHEPRTRRADAKPAGRRRPAEGR